MIPFAFVNPVLIFLLQESCQIISIQSGQLLSFACMKAVGTVLHLATQIIYSQFLAWMEGNVQENVIFCWVSIFILFFIY